MPNQDTVLTSICVVDWRCEALYQSTAQIGPSMKRTFKKCKKEQEEYPLVLSGCLYLQCLCFFSLLECVIMVVIFEGRWSVKAC